MMSVHQGSDGQGVMGSETGTDARDMRQIQTGRCCFDFFSTLPTPIDLVCRCRRRTIWKGCCRASRGQGDGIMPVSSD